MPYREFVRRMRRVVRQNSEIGIAERILFAPWAHRPRVQSERRVNQPRPWFRPRCAPPDIDEIDGLRRAGLYRDPIVTEVTAASPSYPGEDFPDVFGAQSVSAALPVRVSLKVATFRIVHRPAASRKRREARTRVAARARGGAITEASEAALAPTPLQSPISLEKALCHASRNSA